MKIRSGLLFGPPCRPITLSQARKLTRIGVIVVILNQKAYEASRCLPA